MRLDNYSTGNFQRGRSRLIEAVWIIFRLIVFSPLLPFSGLRASLLKLFGAKIGLGVVIRNGAKVKFPWKLEVGDYAWIGEDVWIDNLEKVTIGRNACLSQGAYLCTGSHDWNKPAFDLIAKPIEIGASAWVAAKAVIGPGVLIGEGAVISLGSVVTKNVGPWLIWSSHEGITTKTRKLGKP